MRSMRGFASAVIGAVILAMLGASPATASITLGQLAPTTGTGTCSPFDRVQPTVTSGNSYVVTSDGTIVSWSTNAGANLGQEMTMKMFRHVSGNTYTVVGHDGPRPLNQNSLNTFTTSIPVKVGDVLGMNSTVPGDATTASDCDFGVIGETYLAQGSNAADGAPQTFSVTQNDQRLDVTAVLEPSIPPTNAFGFGAVQRNKKKGTARLTVSVPGPGDLAASGSGLTAQTAAAVTGPGDVQLLVRATGKKKRKLRKSGKVAVSLSVTYTPAGGSPRSQTTSLKLKLKKRH